jgi:hypothetical protein
MNLQIISSTDGKFLMKLITDTIPILLGDYEFIPDYPPIPLADKEWRLYNSNYSIDVREV